MGDNMVLSVLPLIPIFLALTPALTALAINSKGDLQKWLIALIAGGGWFVALIARLPLLTLITKLFQKSYIIVVASSSLLAGIFEEPVRFLLLKYISKEIKLGARELISFGLGWGLVEALIIYVFQAIFMQYGLGAKWFNLLPGAVERNIATLFHIALTFTVAWVLVKEVKYIMLPISLHAMANIYAASLLWIVKDPWIIEGLIGFLIVPLSIVAILIMHRAIIGEVHGKRY